jgi:hypothetical protein
MSPAIELMHRIDAQLAHVWMVRAFLKHSEEAADDDELAAVHRDLYDFMLALGAPLQAEDPTAYFRQARKKLSKLKQALQTFVEIQPAISTHTNFVMAVLSLRTAVQQVEQLLSEAPTTST